MYQDIKSSKSGDKAELVHALGDIAITAGMFSAMIAVILAVTWLPLH